MPDLPIYWLPYFLWMGAPLLALLGAVLLGGLAAWLATRARVVWALAGALVGSVLVPFVRYSGIFFGSVRLGFLLIVPAAVIAFVHFRRAGRRD